MHIASKPTVYKGVTYKSRLEARWAVFLTNCPRVKSFKYEPHTTHHFLYGWTYTPDFLISVQYREKSLNLYLEIKPAAVSKEYLNVLRTFAKDVLAYPLIVMEGDFYNGNIQMYNVIGESIDWFIFGPISVPYEFARTYRFDLEGKHERSTRNRKSVRKNSSRHGHQGQQRRR